MPRPEFTIIPSWERLAPLHEQAVPQRDSLCGAFWGALCLRAAGHDEHADAAVEEELVALHAGTTLPPADETACVPPGCRPNPSRIELPGAESELESGTAASNLSAAIERLSGQALSVVPVAGPWTAERVLGLVEEAAEREDVTLVANVRTGLLWNSRPRVGLLLAHLAGQAVEVPPAEWDVGHFLCLVGSLRGSAGAFILVGDTYPTLGADGYHLQPPEVVARALLREDGREGGVLAVCTRTCSVEFRERLDAGGYDLRFWNNGTPVHTKETV